MAPRLTIKMQPPFGAAFILLALNACVSTPQRSAPDPLVGRVYAAATRQEVSRADLRKRLDTAQVIYLGEKHDNPEHHSLQLEILRELQASGRRPTLGFEVFSVDETSTLQDFLQPGVSGPSEADAVRKLRAAVGWQGTDENWRAYGPLILFAREHDLQMFGADLPGPLRRRMVRSGADGLTPVERLQIHPSGFVNPAYESLMREKLAASHCGHAEPSFLKHLYETWVARNDEMARSIVAALGGGGPIVMILGAGHVEYNMGVFERVAHLQAGVAQLNIGFQEVAGSAQPLAQYLVRPRAGGVTFAPAHEVWWFTARANEGDPCASLKLQPMKAGAPQ